MPRKPIDARFDGLNIKDLHAQGLLYAKRRSSRYHNLRSSPEDFVGEGLCELYANWAGPQQCPAIAFLCVCIKHDMHAEAISAEGRTTETGLPADVVELRDAQPDPEQHFFARRQEHDLLKYIAERDRECAVLAKWYLQLGKTKMKKISNLMGIEINHAYYLKRKLTKITLSYIENSSDVKSSSVA